MQQRNKHDMLISALRPLSIGVLMANTPRDVTVLLCRTAATAAPAQPVSQRLPGRSHGRTGTAAAAAATARVLSPHAGIR